jgi:hypothetical protein
MLETGQGNPMLGAPERGNPMELSEGGKPHGGASRLGNPMELSENGKSHGATPEAPLIAGGLQGLAGTSDGASKRLPISSFSEYAGPLTPPPFVGRGETATPEELERFTAWARQEADLMAREQAGG